MFLLYLGQNQARSCENKGLFQDFQDFRNDQRIDVLFLGKMGTVIELETLAEMLFPCAETHHSRPAVVVTLSDEGKDKVIASYRR